jgi:hypothetical protein
MKIKMPELLLIAGTGRNSGKTTMACSVIQNISKLRSIVAIKITPHFHENYAFGKILVERDDLVIVEETQQDTDKDSSRMLRAGAKSVYFVMAKDEQLKEAFEIILELTPKNRPIVCESGGLIHYTAPGLFLMMNRSETTEFKPGTPDFKALADRWITFDRNHPDLDPETITYSANGWKITPKN